MDKEPVIDALTSRTNGMQGINAMIPYGPPEFELHGLQSFSFGSFLAVVAF